MRWALVRNNIVKNIVIWDGNGNIFDDYITVRLDENSPVSIGWIYDPETGGFSYTD